MPARAFVFLDFILHFHCSKLSIVSMPARAFVFLDELEWYVNGLLPDDV